MGISHSPAQKKAERSARSKSQALGQRGKNFAMPGSNSVWFLDWPNLKLCTIQIMGPGFVVAGCCLHSSQWRGRGLRQESWGLEILTRFELQYVPWPQTISHHLQAEEAENAPSVEANMDNERSEERVKAKEKKAKAWGKCQWFLQVFFCCFRRFLCCFM